MKERAVNRPKRIPLHKQNIFISEQRDGFKRKWVHELPGEVERHELAGYTVVLHSDEETSDGAAQVESQLGSVVRRVVNFDPLAPCKTAVLMEIPLELYEEDQRGEQEKVDKFEKAIKRDSQNKHYYGDVTITQS